MIRAGAPGLAMLVALMTTACKTKAKDCHAIHDPVFSQGSAEVERFPYKPADVAPIAEKLTQMRTQLESRKTAIKDPSIKATADQLDELLGKRIELVQTSTFHPFAVAAPLASAGPRQQALAGAGGSAVAGMLGGPVNGNIQALSANQDAIESLRDRFYNVCLNALF